LRLAAAAYDEPAYEEKLKEIAPPDWTANRFNLFHPAVEATFPGDAAR